MTFLLKCIHFLDYVTNLDPLFYADRTHGGSSKTWGEFFCEKLSNLQLFFRQSGDLLNKHYLFDLLSGFFFSLYDFYRHLADAIESC